MVISLQLARVSSGKGSTYGSRTLGTIHYRGEGGHAKDYYAQAVAFYELNEAQGRDAALLDVGVMSVVALALLMTTLKRCGCSSLLPPKGVLKHLVGSLSVTSKVSVFLQSYVASHLLAQAPMQQIALEVQKVRGGCKRSKSCKCCSPHPPTLAMKHHSIAACMGGAGGGGPRRQRPAATKKKKNKK
jgi:hypothetical protein